MDRLIQILSRLPGLGPRSARRAALHMVKRRESVLDPLLQALIQVRETFRPCSRCGTIDATDPCALCQDPRRNIGIVCVVQHVEDQWALERAKVFAGRYHVLGGLLSPLEGIGPQDLGLDRLLARVEGESIEEVILALPATVEGQTTAHFIADSLKETGVALTGLAQGVPVGGELDYLDEGTLSQALKARRPFPVR